VYKIAGETMRRSPPPPPSTHPNLSVIAEALEPLLRQLVRSIATEVVAEMARSSRDVHVDQRSPALAELRLSPRMYLAAARQGEFPHTRVGRRVVAKRLDVIAWCERKSNAARRRSGEVNRLEDVRADLALPPRSNRRRRLSIRDEARVALGLVPRGTAHDHHEDEAENVVVDRIFRRLNLRRVDKRDQVLRACVESE